MNRMALVGLVALAGCATQGGYRATAGFVGTMTMPELAGRVIDGPVTTAAREEADASIEPLHLGPLPMLGRLSRGRLPRLKLRELVLGANYTTDQLLRGSQPGG